MRLQSDALAYFCEVVDAGSIQAAARNVLIAPSALSRQIRLLEREVGTALFRRAPQGMVPTTAGMELFDFAQRQSVETADILKRIRQGTSEEVSEFRIASVEGVVTHLLPRWLSAVRRRHPLVRFSVEVMASAAVAAAVASGEADAGFTFGRVARADLRELATMPMPIRLAVDKRHSLARDDVVSLESLRDEWCVVPNSQFGIRRELDRACARAGIDLKVAYETNSLAFALRVVQRAGMVTFTTQSMAEDGFDSIVLLPIEGGNFDSVRLAFVGRASASSAQGSVLRHELTALIEAEAADMDG